MSDVVEIMARALHKASKETITPYDELTLHLGMIFTGPWEEKARIALSALDAAGFAVVPKEPTEAMEFAACRDGLAMNGLAAPIIRFSAAYKAMLSASREEGK